MQYFYEPQPRLLKMLYSKDQYHSASALFLSLFCNKRIELNTVARLIEKLKLNDDLECGTHSVPKFSFRAAYLGP